MPMPTDPTVPPPAARGTEPTREPWDGLRRLAERARNTMEVAYHTYARGGQAPAWEAAAREARVARENLHAALTDAVVLSMLDALGAADTARLDAEALAIADEWFGCCDCITTEFGTDERKRRYWALRHATRTEHGGEG